MPSERLLKKFQLVEGLYMHLLNWLMISLFGFYFPLFGQSKDLLQEARAQYQKGEKATTYEERKSAFNQALFLFHTLEQQNPNSSNLDEDLARTYFQLREYAWAILYDERALKKNSLNASLSSRLEEAQKKLGIVNSSAQKSWITSWTTYSHRFQWLFWMILLTFIIFSLSIWIPHTWIRKLAIAFACLLFLCLGHFLLAYYFTPLEGILVQSTGLYREPDWNQPQLTDQPLLAGSKVQILQMTQNGDWLKIENSSGVIGYVPTTRLRGI